MPCTVLKYGLDLFSIWTVGIRTSNYVLSLAGNNYFEEVKLCFKLRKLVKILFDNQHI